MEKIVNIRYYTQLILLFLLFSTVFSWSAEGEEQDKELLKKAKPTLDNLERVIKKLKYKKNDRTAYLREHLSEDSHEWLENMAEAASYETAEELEERPFFELLTVLGLRLLYRNQELDNLDSGAVLRVLEGKYGLLRRAFGLSNVAAPWIEEELGEYYGFQGMASSSRVAVFFYIWEDDVWKLDLAKMLPVVSRGIETVGLKQQWSPSETALFLLEKALEFKVSKELLDP
jgi:hypothetical protein